MKNSRIFPLILFGIVSSCAFVSEPESDSRLTRLEVGMTRFEVFEILGNPVQVYDPGLACLSFLYNENEDAWFTWVFFEGRDDVAESFSDRHETICGLT